MSLADRKNEQEGGCLHVVEETLAMVTGYSQTDFLACSDDPSAAVIAFVSKIFAVDASALPSNQPKYVIHVLSRFPMWEAHRCHDVVTLCRPLTMKEILDRRESAKQRALEQSSLTAVGGHEGERPADSSATKSDTQDPTLMFLAFARVFSGTIRRGQQLFVLHPRYDPREVDVPETTLCLPPVSSSSSSLPPHTSLFTVPDLYLLMGREVVAVDAVAPGNIVGIAGLEQQVLKSATLSSTLACPAFTEMGFMAFPIVRVAIEPVHASDMPALTQGMRLLNQADPCVEVTLQETGEHVLAAAGEVHLKRCLDDLREQFARVDIEVSAPIISFRETVIPPPTVDMVNEVISSENEVQLVTNPLLQGATSWGASSGSKRVTVQTSNKCCSLEVEARPLPEAVTCLLETNAGLLKALSLVSLGAKETTSLAESVVEQLAELRQELSDAFVAAGDEWEGACDQIWCFGPRNSGPNVLLNQIGSYRRQSVWSYLDLAQRGEESTRDYDSSIVNGFQLASLTGPLCDEPLHGVCLVLHEWHYSDGSMLTTSEGSESCHDNQNDSADTRRTTTETNVEEQKGKLESSVVDPEGLAGSRGEDHRGTDSPRPLRRADVYGPFSGQLMSAMKKACRKAVLAQPARLMAAMYTCDILVRLCFCRVEVRS